jgi:hypothetical protein
MIEGHIEELIEQLKIADKTEKLQSADVDWFFDLNLNSSS